MGPQLEALANKHANVKLRKVDIVEWGSDVAKQYAIRSLPTLWVYEDGELFSKDRREVIAKLNTLQ